jgi:hypothetical protein
LPRAGRSCGSLKFEEMNPLEEEIGRVVDDVKKQPEEEAEVFVFEAATVIVKLNYEHFLLWSCKCKIIICNWVYSCKT